MLERLKEYLRPKLPDGHKKVVCWVCHRPTIHKYEELYDEDRDENFKQYSCTNCGIVSKYYEKEKDELDIQENENGICYSGQQ